MVRGEAEYVGVAPECCSLVVYAARGLFTESIEAFRVSGSQMLGGSYAGKGVAELHLRLLDDAVRTFKEGSEHSGVAGEDNLRIIPHLPAWPRDHVRLATLLRDDQLVASQGFPAWGEPGAGVRGGSGSPRRQARASHDHGNGSSTTER